MTRPSGQTSPRAPGSYLQRDRGRTAPQSGGVCNHLQYNTVKHPLFKVVPNLRPASCFAPPNHTQNTRKTSTCCVGPNLVMLSARTVSSSSWDTPHRSPRLSSSRRAPPNARLLRPSSVRNTGREPRHLGEDTTACGPDPGGAWRYAGPAAVLPVRVVEQVEPPQGSQLGEPAVVERGQLVVGQVQLLQAPQRVEGQRLDHRQSVTCRRWSSGFTFCLLGLQTDSSSHLRGHLHPPALLWRLSALR